MKKADFPLSLAAYKECDGAQFSVGDALLKECGPPPAQGKNDGSRAKLEACAEFLAEHGFDVKVEYLAAIRSVAFRFPVSARSDSFTVLSRAGDIETLNAIRKGLKKGERLSVSRAMNEIRRLREAQKEEARAKANVELNAARSASNEAKEAVKAATTDTGRKEAAKKVAAADARIKSATAIIMPEPKQPDKDGDRKTDTFGRSRLVYGGVLWGCAGRHAGAGGIKARRRREIVRAEIVEREARAQGLLGFQMAISADDATLRRT